MEDREWRRWKTGKGEGRRWLSERQGMEKVEDREWGKEEEAEWKTGNGEGGRQEMGKGGGG